MRFEDHSIRIGVLYAGGRWRAILSVSLSLGVSRDGLSLETALNEAHGGSLPVPRALLTRMLDPLLQEARAHRDGKSHAVAWLASVLREVESVEQAFTGVTIRNRFTWFNGRRPFRIDAIEIVPGALRLRIEPL